MNQALYAHMNNKRKKKVESEQVSKIKSFNSCKKKKKREPLVA
jgi:hypothetical protein